jgi:Fe-S-cluster containining protein
MSSEIAPIGKEGLRKFINYCKGNGAFSALRKILDKVPESSCAMCGRCCCASTGISVVEFAYECDMIRRRKLEQSNPELPTGIFGYLWSEWIDPSKSCPFLKNNKCLIYEFRPLECRKHGLTPPEIDDIVCTTSGNMKEVIRKDFLEEGISIPDSIINNNVGRCSQIKRIDGKTDFLDVLPLFNESIALDEKYASRSPLNMGLPLHFSAYLAYALLGSRYRVVMLDSMRAFQAGEDSKSITQRLLDKVAFSFSNLS